MGKLMTLQPIHYEASDNLLHNNKTIQTRDSAVGHHSQRQSQSNGQEKILNFFQANGHY